MRWDIAVTTKAPSKLSWSCEASAGEKRRKKARYFSPHFRRREEKQHLSLRVPLSCERVSAHYSLMARTQHCELDAYLVYV